MNSIYISHERTLLGAIDSFMGGIVHVRPYLAGAYRDQLEELAATWLHVGGKNEVEAVDQPWIETYLTTIDSPEVARSVLNEFFAWARQQQVLHPIPLY